VGYYHGKEKMPPGETCKGLMDAFRRHASLEDISRQIELRSYYFQKTTEIHFDFLFIRNK
jgi:hypothetical protein